MTRHHPAIVVMLLRRTSVALVVGMTVLAHTSVAHAEADASRTSTTADAIARALVRAHAAHVPSGAITVDGRADDPAWRTADVFDAFVQQDPDEGRPASEPTHLRVAYDERALYVLVEAHDSVPDQILGQLTRRDADSASDWVHVWLDTHEDEKSAYRFSVNAAGVKQDARVFEDNQEDLAWDGVWDAATTTSTTGWVAELRIPFSVLRFDEAHDRWGFEARRDLRRRNEKSYLAPIPRSSGRMVSWFGKLDGLDRLPATWDLSLVPYVRAGLVDDDGARSFDGAVGGEGRLGLGSSMVLDFTVNPDFGQVEADPSVLNLSASEVYFEEKRPFFIEGRELLRYPIDFGDGTPELLYYSRRVGREPIYGAAKITGRSSEGWSLGVLEALSARGTQSTAALDGEREISGEPLANVAVLRLSKDYRDGQTTVGLVATHQIHALNPTTRPEWLRNAGSGGLDLSHRVGDYLFSARVYGSLLDGSPEAITAIQRSSVHYFQRPDATHLGVDPTRTSLAGWGTTIVAGKPNGETWRFTGGLQLQSPGFEPNPLGYLQRADRQVAFVRGQLRDDEPGELLRAWALTAETFVGRTFGGELNGIRSDVNLAILLPSYVELYFVAGPSLALLDITALRGGPALLYPSKLDFTVGGKTDERNSFVFACESWLTVRDDGGGMEIGGEMNLKFHPTSALELSLHPFLERTIEDAQYVDTLAGAGANGGPAWIVGHLERDTASLALRADWTLDPNLTLQVYVSPYLSAGTYRDFRRVTSPRADRYEDRFAPFAYSGSDRFLFRELRSNVVLRWEYALGSTLYFVWSHGQTSELDDRGGLRFGRDLQELVGAPSSDTVMVKLAHWLAL